MYKILFVCHGNICRSPMAEFCMKDLIGKEGLSDRISVESAAVSSEEEGNPVYPPAARTLLEHGLSCEGKRARKITPADYDRFDLIIGMDRSNIRRMGAVFGGDPKGKILRLLDFTDRPRDVEDPWFTGDFDGVWIDIEKGCKAALEQVKKRAQQSGAAGRNAQY